MSIFCYLSLLGKLVFFSWDDPSVLEEPGTTFLSLFLEMKPMSSLESFLLSHAGHSGPKDTVRFQASRKYTGLNVRFVFSQSACAKRRNPPSLSPKTKRLFARRVFCKGLHCHLCSGNKGGNEKVHFAPSNWTPFY